MDPVSMGTIKFCAARTAYIAIICLIALEGVLMSANSRALLLPKIPQQSRNNSRASTTSPTVRCHSKNCQPVVPLTSRKTIQEARLQ